MLETVGNTFLRFLSCLLQERSRWFLWLPVLFAIGIAVYFNITWHPEIYWLLLPVFPLFLLFFSFIRHIQVIYVTVFSLIIGLAGFSTAIIRTEMVKAPVLEKKVVTVLTATVLHKSAGNKKHRLVLEEPDFQKKDIPVVHKIRLTSRTGSDDIRPGDRVSVKAVLLPPPPPAYPGAYDFQRESYYRQIGAVGYTLGRFERYEKHDNLRFQDLSSWLRDTINRYIVRNGPKESAGFSVAIMTGDKGLLSKQELDHMREAGLAHLLAISGLHMGMIGGLIFFVIRLAGSLVPGIALRYPVKKWAALLSLIGLAGYLLVSGMSISALRAFLMISMVFLAICFDRTAISLRNLALAALAILILFPESLLTASFQMSFSAVFCLIATYERYGDKLMTRAGDVGIIKRSALYLTGILLTSLVASLATAPFALYHFGQFSLLGIVANLVAVPVMGLWVMPWTVAAFILMPFAETGIALELAGNGITVILWVAEQVASIPGSTLRTGTYPLQALTILIIGTLWFLIWKTEIRWFSALAILVTIPMIVSIQEPDILFSRSGNLYLIRHHETLLVSTRRADRFERERWGLLYGEEPVEKIDDFTDKMKGIACDTSGCVLFRDKQLIAFSHHRYASDLDCRRAHILLSRQPVGQNCRHPDIIIDKFDLWREGTHALYLSKAGKTRIETVNAVRGSRPWVPTRYRQATGMGR